MGYAKQAYPSLPQTRTNYSKVENYNSFLRGRVAQGRVVTAIGEHCFWRKSDS